MPPVGCGVKCEGPTGRRAFTVVCFYCKRGVKWLSATIDANGATYEGTFRNHYIMPDGSSRNSPWFSIVRKEWPEVKDMPTRRLRAPV